MHCAHLRRVPLHGLNISFILFINQNSTFMKKNLFLTCALALFAVVGVSAQDWCRTLATGTAGEQITHDVNGTSVTQYRAETALIQNAGATGVRYTVMQTGALNQLKRVGPCFAIGEIFVLDAAGDTIDYTVTSNAGHNELTGGTDGAGLPAVNDGNLNNFFHTVWNDSYAIDEYHYLELTFEKSVDAFQLVWYTRPNQHQNRPLVIGLTNPGVTFTEDMLFAEYEFSLGEPVTDLATLQAGGTFTLYAEGLDNLADYGDGSVTDANGSTYIALNTNTYTVGSYPEAAPQNIVQFIPAADGRVILYQPIMATYYSDPCRWTSNYNGKNGWLMSHADAQFLDEFTFIAAGNGEFEITTELYRQEVDGNWVNFDEPMTVWVGYDPRGNLKIFDEAHKQALEQQDYTQGFAFPVDFTFKINKAEVNKELVPDKTATEMCSEVLKGILETAKAKQEEYADYMDYDWDGGAEELNAALAAAESAIAEGDLAAAFAAKKDIELALALFVSMKMNYYFEVLGSEQDKSGLWGEYLANAATKPYKQQDTGKFTEEAKKTLEQIQAKLDACQDAETGELLTSYTALESNFAAIDALIELFPTQTLFFSTFPEIVSDIPADNFPYAELPNNAVWRKNVILAESTEGVRLTFLDRHIGSAGDGGNYPMIALGEVKLYDANGTEVALTETNFYANHTETQEGFESTVARLCDGNFGAQGYYHSPWSGAEPQEYIYLDITFPGSMENFTVEVYSRDKSTSQNKVSLFPKKVAITKVGEAYDPLLFTENPYNVAVGEKVADVANLKDGGLYVIKGLLNTVPVYKEVTEGEGEEAVTTIELTEAEGVAKFYHGTDRFHENAVAVRADGVYRFVKNADGTYKFLSLGLGKYWPSTTETGYVDDKTTYEAEKAANIHIVASTNVEGAFVMYEYAEGLTTENDSIDSDDDGELDTAGDVYQTPYVMFMDWANRLATRPVVNPQPVVTSEELADNWGDAQCFVKENGESEWEIYEVSIDNPDFFYLTNLVGAFDELGLVVGTNPGEVSNLGNLEGVYEDAQKVIADSVYVDAAAAAAALAKEIAVVNSLEKNPMAPGVYQIVSANPDFKAKQNVEKALYAHVTEDGTPTFGWKTIEQDNNQFYFDFQQSEEAANLVEGGTVAEEYKDVIYTIRAVATYEGATPYYIGEADAQSTQIDLFSDMGSDYLVLNANGSAFCFRLAGKGAGFSIHANQHGGGTGQSGNIVYWDGGAGASQWYLRKVDYETSIDDFVVEGTEVVAVSYFTPAGAAVPAPVKGINVVVTVYANGVVETKKVLVK